MKHWMNGVKSSWHHALTLLWLMIIALQWISYTEPFWLEETTAAVLLTLVAVALIEIIIPVKWIYRLMLEGVAIVYLVYRILLHYGEYVPNPWLPTLRERLPDIITHMNPYIWFALGAWALMLLSSWWVNGKARILMFIGMNITAFAALDSFTTSVLWQEVAWTVFAGMGWLVTRHLRSFQLHYPRGWTYLLQYPFKVALNIAIIFSLVIIAGVNMPDVRPTLTDPYTVWQEWSGNTPSSGTSAGGSGESSSGEGTGGATTSGYSLNDDNLGGGFNFDYSPVMTVTSDLRTYMRGEIRSTYSGKGWSDDDTFSRGTFRTVQVGEPLEPVAAPKTETRTLTQTVKLLGGNNYPVLFGGYSIVKVNSVDGVAESNGLSWRGEDSELLWNAAGSARSYPQTYVVTSEVPVVPFQELSTQTYEQLYGDLVLDPYLQLPGNFPERVRALAEEITAGAQTPYEKVMLLQQYLQQTFPYTNQPDVSRARSKDMVESFLFEIMEGYCDYYSTALVTMVRSLDIPARWVKGYAPGEQAEIPDNLALQQGGLVNNNYTITNADAHSWAEIYFGDYGWVPVEATPGFNVPVLTQTEEDNVAEPEVQEEEQAEPEQEAANTAAGSEGFHPGVWVVTGAAVVLLLWSGFLLWQRRMSLRFLITRLRIGHQLTPVQKVVAETQRWVRYVRSKGMLKKEHETLRESVERWSLERPAAAVNLSTLLGMFERANYSPEVIEDKDWHSVYTEALRLRKSMKSGK
ncbi:transglutaminase-like domain-containing protein [Paenibacillus sp. FSL E2-0178]|uniref:transglutaminase-like domain-containing protein n=1 Tax=Paenibacillus sp. FSL E2-0178 TaxID=2921361 RepID=UPI003158B84B